MKFTVGKKEFSRSLGHCLKFTEPRRGTLPILQNVMIRVEGGAVELSATDLEAGIRERIPGGKANADGAITLPAKPLRAALQKVGGSSGDPSFALLPENWVEIQCGKLSVKMMGLGAKDFPVLPRPPEGAFSMLDAGLFAEMVRKTGYAASRDETRYNLTGLLLKMEKGKLRMVATDGYRLALVNRPAGEVNGLGKKGALLPRAAAVNLANIMGAGEMLVQVSKGHFFAGREGAEICMRLLDAEFPDYKDVIPAEIKIKATANRKELIEALARVSQFASERTKGVRFRFSPGLLALSAHNSDFGEAVEEVAVGLDEGELEVEFDFSFVLECLGSIESDEVLIGLNDAVSPIVICPKGEADPQLCVIMPMKL